MPFEVEERACGAPEGLILPGETADAALGRAVRIIQPAKGYRFSVDAVLLARFAAACGARQAVDLCCGSGVVGLCLLALGGAESVLGIDIQPEFVDRARRSARWNGWDRDRAWFETADIRNVSGLGRAGVADLVVANPPYRPLSEGKASEDPAIAAARHEVHADLDAAAAAAAHLLKVRGTFCVVYPARRLAGLLAGCRAARLEPKRIRLVHPREGEEASLALVEAVKGACEGLRVNSPLILHGVSGVGEKYSEEARFLLGPP